MNIQSAGSNLTKVISSNLVFSALKQKKGFALPTKSEQARRDLVQLSSLAKKAALIGQGTARIHADSEIENPGSMISGRMN